MRLGKFEQTVFLTHDNKNLVYLNVADRDGCNEWSLSVTIDGNTVIPRTTYPYTEGGAKLLFPNVEEDTEAVICLEGFLDNAEYFSVTLKPVHEKYVHILSSSHEDLGYCAYANELGKSCTDYINKAVEIAKKRRDYKYTIEHYWMLDSFNKYATDDEKQTLKEQFKNGNIGLGAAFCGVHTSWQTKEQLIRGVQHAVKCRDKWGISPKTAVYTDISGISSSAISAYSECGIKYAAILENLGFRSRPAKYNFPILFRWKAKNSDNSLICWHQTGYSLNALDAVWKPSLVFDETKASETEKIINNYAQNEASGYDVIPISFYHDREIPDIYLADICKAMNARWKSPVFSVSLPDEIFSDIEKHHANSLPVLSGELCDQWADFASIYADWMSDKRYTQNTIRSAEAMSVIDSVTGSTHYPEYDIDKVYCKMGEFDEHCWPTVANKPLKMHIFNTKLVKEHNAKSAKEITNKLLYTSDNSAMQQNKKLYVKSFVPYSTYTGAHLNCGVKGIDCQKLYNNTVITSPVNSEGFGVNEFEVDDTCTVIPAKIHNNTVDTGMYTVTCSHETGNILSIIDKESGRELIDKNAYFKMCDFIYVHDQNAVFTFKDNTTADLRFETAKTRKFSIEQGPVATVIRKTAYEEQLGANVSITLIFYKKEKNIDVKLEFKNAFGLMGSQLDRYRKNIFFAFPFKSDKRSFYTQTSADILQEPDDRLKNAPHDFVVANSWVAVDGTNGGICLYSKDMPVFHLGGIHYNSLSTDATPRSTGIFLYAATNRCNQLVYRSEKDCNGKFDLSILPYQGEIDTSALNRWAEQKNHPLTAFTEKINDRIFEIDNKNITLCALKKADDDNNVIIRLYNETDTSQDFSVTLPFEISDAKLVLLNEETVTEGVNISGNNTLYLHSEKGAYVTVKLYLDSAIECTNPPSTPYIDELFSYEIEHDKTVVCFKKHNCKQVKGFRILSEANEIATLDNTELEVQFCEIEETELSDISVEIIP